MATVMELLHQNEKACHDVGSMATWKILPGLPPYGPPADAFAQLPGRGAHHEGFVVEITPDDGRPWVGNFQPGWTRLSTVVVEPATDNVIVIAQGQAYVIEPSSRKCVRMFGNVWDVFEARPDLLVIFDGQKMQAVGKNGVLWTSRDIAIDGIRAVEVNADTITGQAAMICPDRWVEFTLDVATGEVRDGAAVY